MSEGPLVAEGQWTIGLVFCLSLLVFTGIGILSSTRKKKTTSDYLLAGRGVSPWLVGLSAFSTNCSGFMFVGMIGFTYRSGLSSSWMLIGWAAGDYLAWKFLYQRLRERSEAQGEVSVLALLRPRHSSGRNVLVPVAGLLTVFYLAMYAAGQLKAGSTALQSTFGIPGSWGAIIGAAIVVVYCYSGGIRASIWTDAAQSISMLGSMALLVGIAVVEVGGPGQLLVALSDIDSRLITLFPEDARLGFLLYFIGMFLGGFGVVGQPHILVRSMCIKEADQIKRARLYYFLFLIPFYAMAIAVGLHARVLLPELAASAHLTTEHALPVLSVTLLPEILIGLMLAGLFSATMSTADSQVIACSSAIIQDIRPHWKNSYKASKISTITVTAIALAIALSSSDGVFALVLKAWGVLSCSLGPLLVISLLNWPYSQRMALAMMAVGFVAANGWAESPWTSDIYVNLPGMAAVFLSYGIMLGIHRLRFSREAATVGGREE